MTHTRPPLRLFEGYGLELEYMIVDQTTHQVLPISDWLLATAGQEGTREVSRGEIMWSNELAMHVIELKGDGPVAHMASLLTPLQKNIVELNQRLAEKNACLMGSAVHPWMNPDTDTKLWMLEDAPIYNALDRVFGCQGHGWFNLQSAHLNLPFANDDEFARLHAAIRLILPIIPAIAASSPFLDGADKGVADARLLVYSRHCNRLPEAMGDVIPEPAQSEQQYHDVILLPMYRALRPRDPEETLCYEWSNARGAIARFDRNAIEIRLIDVQEHPGMDIAVVSAIAAAVQLLTNQAGDDLHAMNQISSVRLRSVLDDTIRDAENAQIKDEDILFLLTGNRTALPARQLWQTLLSRCDHFTGAERNTAQWILDHGTLSSRMRRRVPQATPHALFQMTEMLCRSLADATPFE